MNSKPQVKIFIVITIGSREQLDFCMQKSLNSKAFIIHPIMFQSRRLGPQHSRSRTPMALATRSSWYISKAIRIGKVNQAKVRDIDIPSVHSSGRLEEECENQLEIVDMSHFISRVLIPQMIIKVQQKL